MKMKSIKIALIITSILFSFFSVLSEASSRNCKCRCKNGMTFKYYHDIDKNLFKSSVTFGGVGVLVEDRWDFNMSLMGRGNTRNNRQKVQRFYSISRIVDPGWEIPYKMFKDIKIKLRLGLSHTPDIMLIGENNYRVGVILEEKDKWYIEYVHYSSKDIYELNDGIDGILMGYRFK